MTRDRVAPLPSATIVVPVTNGWEATLRCLLSVAERSTGVRREVIVVDNGSTDDTRLALPHLDDVRVIRNAADEGFVRACNQAAAQSAGDVLVVLDRDAEVGAGWLERIAARFAAPDVAAAVPGEALSGAFLAIRAAEYRAEGGLDEGSATAADDLLARFLRRGLRVEVAEDVPLRMTAPSTPARASPPRPPISVVVPVRNAAETLAACLRAIEDNLRPADEVVIADGGSDDETLRHAFEFAARHHRNVKVVDDAGGVAGALRRGLATATHEHALTASPRAAMPNGFVEGAFSLLEREPGAAALAIEVSQAGVVVLGRADDLRAVADANPNALFKSDGVTLGRALDRLGKRLAFVPASR